MKKSILIVGVAIALSCCACKTAETTTEKPKIDYSKITVENVLEKSNEIRENIKTYKTAQQAANATENTKSAATTLKDNAKEKYNEIRQKVSDEAAAWKETLKK